MTVSHADRVAMARLLQIMNGESPPSVQSPHHQISESHRLDPLPGAGQVTSADVKAMHDVLSKLNQVVNQTHDSLITESAHDAHTAEALITERHPESVRIGSYKIAVRTDESRMAGKQYYDVIHSVTGEKLAHELTLYEAAHGLVRMLNKGQFVNSKCVRELLETEAAYTSHRIDAIRYHGMIKKCMREGADHKLPLYEARKEASLDRAAQAKVKIKQIYNKL